MSKLKVYVGMSGGVDSSLSAALLVEQGYDVTGVYMKNWTTNLPGMKCPWADDLADAKRVAVGLGIDFKVFDFEKDYRDRVVKYMIDEYKAGRTPNPDIMCNQEVKFKLFLETALDDGADMIATGHYARVGHVNVKHASISSERLRARPNKGPGALLDLGCRCSSDIEVRSRVCTLEKAIDEKKDQTYFLYRVTGEALAHTIFPIGEYTKPNVRKMAEERGLVTATKKDSQGICFVGQVGIRDFLEDYVDFKPGNIIDRHTGKVLGTHDGAIFYTIGQRHGLDLGGGLPYYVVGKDMDKNEIYVTTNINDKSLWIDEVKLTNVHWINEKPKDREVEVRLRHQAPLIKAKLKFIKNGDALICFLDSQKAIAPGQSIVIYQGDTCLGGGIVV